jgi:hypothetical protein
MTTRLTILVFSVTCLILISALPAIPQSQEKIYSTLILNFSKGIEWPTTQSNEFVIGVFEYDPLAMELKTMSTSMKAGSKKIVVKTLTAVDDAASCNVLFVPAYKSKLMPALLQKIGKSPTLIITNKVNMARNGSGVNFILVNGKLQYEINCKAIESRGLKVSAGIKSLGIVVD